MKPDILCFEYLKLKLPYLYKKKKNWRKMFRDPKSKAGKKEARSTDLIQNYAANLQPCFSGWNMARSIKPEVTLIQT